MQEKLRILFGVRLFLNELLVLFAGFARGHEEGGTESPRGRGPRHDQRRNLLVFLLIAKQIYTNTHYVY